MLKNKNERNEQIGLSFGRGSSTLMMLILLSQYQNFCTACPKQINSNQRLQQWPSLHLEIGSGHDFSKNRQLYADHQSSTAIDQIASSIPEMKNRCNLVKFFLQESSTQIDFRRAGASQFHRAGTTWLKNVKKNSNLFYLELKKKILRLDFDFHFESKYLLF